MGRTPLGLNRGPWTRDEDLRLRNYIEAHGEGGWRTLPIKAGLLRCGKSCRLRWMNYLRPDVKCGHILPEEEELILRLHRLLGNRWALIAGRIPGRTDNEIKNYWNTHLSKKLISQGIDPRTHKHLSESEDQGSNHGDREISKRSQRKTNARADLQDVSSKGGQAITIHVNEDDRKSTTCPANNVDHFPEISPTCNPQPASVAINCSSQTSGIIPSRAYAFQETIFNNNNMGSRKIPYPPSPLTCFDSLAPRGTGHYDLDQYLMKNPVTSSNNMITSTLRLNSGLQAPPFLGNLDSNQAFMSANALLYNEKLQTSLQVSDFPASSAVPDEVTTMSYTSNHISPTSVEAALGDFSSDIFRVLLESFVHEIRETDAHISMPQNVQLCPLNQPESADLSDDLWSVLSPSSQ